MGLWESCLLAAAAVIVVYLLYARGIAMTKSISAIFFSFRTGRSRDQAHLNTCTGWVQHAGRFPESRVYTFTFDCQLTGGEAAVLLLDQEKRELMRLDKYLTAGTIELRREDRYVLRWEFQSATGRCVLRW